MRLAVGCWRHRQMMPLPATLLWVSDAAWDWATRLVGGGVGDLCRGADCCQRPSMRQAAGPAQAMHGAGVPPGVESYPPGAGRHDDRRARSGLPDVDRYRSSRQPRPARGLPVPGHPDRARSGCRPSGRIAARPSRQTGLRDRCGRDAASGGCRGGPFARRSRHRCAVGGPGERCGHSTAIAAPSGPRRPAFSAGPSGSRTHQSPVARRSCGVVKR